MFKEHFFVEVYGFDTQLVAYCVGQYFEKGYILCFDVCIVVSFIPSSDMFVINIFTNHIVAPSTIATMAEMLTKSLSVSSLRRTIASDTRSLDTNYIYKNELDKACFQHDVAYGDFKDLERRTASDKV